MHMHTYGYINVIQACFRVNFNYRISSKSRRGEILFQGSVWCGDNSRAARFRGWHLQRSTRTCAYMPSIISLFVCMYNVRAHMYIAGDPLPCSKISRVAFIGMSMQKHAARFRGRRDFEVQRDFEEIRYLQSEHTNIHDMNDLHTQVAPLCCQLITVQHSRIIVHS